MASHPIYSHEYWSTRKNGIQTVFSARYNTDVLAYYEAYSTIEEAIAREKQLKKYSKMKKRTLINQFNPEWKDLFEEVKEW